MCRTGGDGAVRAPFGGDGVEAGAHISYISGCVQEEGYGAVLAPCRWNGAEAGALILRVGMCAGRGVMVHYVLPVEGMVQKLVLLSTSLAVCRTRGDGAICAPRGGDGAEAQVWLCAGRGVMVQYVLPVEGMVQKLVLVFYKCSYVQDGG
jgi:hypothetical protein